MTGHHWNCKKIISYYDKTWVCECPHPDQTLPDTQDNNGLDQKICDIHLEQSHP